MMYMKDKAITNPTFLLDCLTPEDETNRLSENVTKLLLLHNNPADLFYTMAEA